MLMGKLRWLKEWYVSRQIAESGPPRSAADPPGPPVFLDEETIQILFPWGDRVAF
jgi:hypothetical protein